MLTLDDQRVRTALIQTHATFSDRARWVRGNYFVEEEGTGATARCMMGEIAHQLGFDTTRNVLGTLDSYEQPMLDSIRDWFYKVLGRKSPERFNDHRGYEAVQEFLEARIADLDHELFIDNRPEPEEADAPVPGRVASMFALLSTLFG